MKIITRMKWNKFTSLLATKYITINVILLICIKTNFLIKLDKVKSSAFFSESSSLIISFIKNSILLLSLLLSLFILIFSLFSFVSVIILFILLILLFSSLLVLIIIFSSFSSSSFFSNKGFSLSSLSSSI